MKKIYLAFTLAIIPVISFGQGNIINNGDFEDWTSGVLNQWDIQEGQVNQENTIISSGSSSALFIDGSTTPRIASQNFTLNAGETYKLSFDFKVKTANASFGQQVISYRYGSTDFTPYTSGNRIPQNFEWTTHESIIEVADTELWGFEISLFSFLDEPFEVYIDNIKLINVKAEEDKQALIALYNATDGPNWTNTWDLNADISTWHGITVNNEGRVTEIILYDNNLSGYIPEAIGDLTNLTRLSLYNNELEGNIPETIGNLINLTYLRFDYNNLEGTIPETIGNLNSLTYLDLGTNNLEGIIPETIGDLTNITRLGLNNNDLIGNIPESIGNLTSLTRLNLDVNNFEGNIPESFENLTNLMHLSLRDNNLTGNIPNFIGNLISLNWFSLHNNNFEGTIPESIGNLTNLTSLNLGSNDLTGNIPESIINLTNLLTLNLGVNNFEGNIPDSILNLNNLNSLNLSTNNFEGIIPESIGNLSNLTFLSLDNNNFEGSIPESIGNLSNLSRLYLSDNNLTGNIPDSIGSLTNLTGLYLGSNYLEGNIPDFTALTLSSLVLGFNSFIFEDIEPHFSFLNSNNYHYYHQKIIDDKKNVELLKNEDFSISVEGTSSPNNTYQWLKDGINIEGATNSTYTISSVSGSDSGEYICRIDNTIVTDLTLYKSTITLNVLVPDSDNDGVNDELDSCPNTPEEDEVDVNGCSQSQLDDDLDGITNDLDQCPYTPIGEDTDTYGCSQSQLDNDLDRVTNDLDKCSDTPHGEIVDLNGCSQSQLDDDNDGINNNLDQCLNTSVGEDVDANGCSQSQLDDDNDGVKNNLDQCPDTPDGENVNFNGCSQSQLDDDKDGIMNDIDECPETPLGEIVNEKGCSQSDVLGNSPVQVVGISTTCPNTNNGEIIVDANNNVSNQIVVSGPNYNETFSGLSGSENVIITDLAPGIYNICVTYQGYEANYCSSVNIEETEELTSSKAQVDLQNKNASFYVSGSKHYEVLVNNILYKYNVDNTATTKIEVPLEKGINEVVLKTDKTCQGEKRQTISFANLSFYPNPAEDYLNIAGLNEFTEIEVYITDLAGNRITSQVLDKGSSSLRIPLYNLSVGVYIVNIKTDTQTMNTKIYKK